MVAPLERKIGSLESEILSFPRMQTKTTWEDASAGCTQGRFFAQVLQLKPCSKVVYTSLKGRSSHCMDLFQVTACFEVGYGRNEQRVTVDCFDLEKPEKIGALESSSLLAAGSTKKMRGNSVKQWVKYLLGLFHSELGWTLTGLFEGLLAGFEGIPLRKKIWVLKILKSQGLRVWVFSKAQTHWAS
jgi:hypothetical protein